jgi:hypothetical protein
MSGRDQSLIDSLQAAIPRVQLIVQSSQRQHEDAAAVLDALATAVQVLRPPTPHAAERQVTSLQRAIVRSGKTVSETAFLAGIPEPRLRHLTAGAKPTDTERTALLRALPDWQG